MATIMIPIPLIDCGLLPEPHLASGAEASTLGSMTADELQEFFRHALFVLHPCFVLITWAGYEVLDLEVAQVVGGAVTGTSARLDMLTMEIGEGRWTAQTADGIYVVLFMRERPGLPARPLPLTVRGLPLAGEVEMRLNEDASQPWDQRVAELLPQLESWANTVGDEFRSAIRSARGALAPANWIRDPLLSGFLSMYDYTSWRFDVIEGAPTDWSAPITGVAQLVWGAITASDEAFDRFLAEEPARADGLSALVFPGLPLVSAFQRVSALDPPGVSTRADALAHNVDAVNLIYPGLLSLSDLDLLSYTELLVVANEIQAVDIAPVAPLSGEELREQIRLRLNELSPVAYHVLDDLENWQEINYNDYATALEGEVPSYAVHDWWLGFFANLLAESVGTAAPDATQILLRWIAGAKATISLGMKTQIGFVVGLAASIVLGDLLSPSEAEKAVRITAASERIRYLSELFSQKARDAKQEASRKLDERILELRLRTDAFTDEAELQTLYSEVMTDLETCVQRPVPPLKDRSLANSHLHTWLLAVGWGFMPYDDQGLYAPTTALVAKVRDRVLVWAGEDNATLFLSQCEYEWRSLGFACTTVLETLRSEAVYGAAFSQQLIDGRVFTFYGYEIDPDFREKWEKGYSSTLTFGLLDPYPVGFGDGSTRVTKRGITEIGIGQFSARCTLRLAVTAGSCRVTAFEYRLEGQGDYFAERFVSTDVTGPVVSLEPVPNPYHDYAVVPDRPVFGP